MIREVVKIDEEKCNGCGVCVPACAEGAIRIVGGKAKLIADNLCDGLGACLGHCPQDAIVVERRDAEAFDEEAVSRHLGQSDAHAENGAEPGGGCPSARVVSLAPPSSSPPGENLRPTSGSAGKEIAENPPAGRESQLRQWPVQMHLVPPTAPFLKDADLLLVADCVPFAYGGFHRDFLTGKALLIGCPKLDDGQAYLDKLTAILRQNVVRRLTVLHMEVPCCSGLVAIARRAIAASGSEVPLETIKIGIGGEVKG
jgi:Pyruvate/2-oxoacid:ferredoxin oxidoreductase delta subunit